MRKLENIILFLIIFNVVLLPAYSQEPNAPPALNQGQIEQLVAPVALYPDSLLSQIFMASTYPLEIVQAYRWVEVNKGMKGDEFAAALEKQNWDPSVKSLTNFPSVLKMMNEKLDWMQKLGDAFLSQQKDVMAAVQNLRSKAYDQGNLKSNTEQVVTKEEQTIVIESPEPQEIYVPTYDPSVVYGSWAYPAYPPYYYYPPGYVSGSNLLSFGAGFGLGAAWGYAWGHCDWHGGDINVDYNRNLNYNRNIDRGRYAQQYGNRGQFNQGGMREWQHDPSHRGGVAYSNQTVAQRFNHASNANAMQARDAYRGRTQGGQNLQGNADRVNRQQAMQRQSQLSSGSAARYTGSGGVSNRGSAFQDMNRGNSVRSDSSRGQASRQSMSRPSGGGGGGGRGGGGGGRGGGGRR
jgi:hypothetical protein